MDQLNNACHLSGLLTNTRLNGRSFTDGLPNSQLNIHFWYGTFIILHGARINWFFCFSCSIFLVIVFLCLCFYTLYFVTVFVILSLLLVIMGDQHDWLLLSGSPPILYIHLLCSRQINSAAAAEKQSHSGHILRRPTQMNAAYFMGRQVLNSIWLSLKLHCTDTRQPATTTTVAQQMSTQAVVCRY